MDNPTGAAASLLEIAQGVIAAISPIAVAYLAYLTQKRSKNDAKYRELLEENAKLEKEEQERKEKESAKQIEELSKNVKTLSEDVETLREEFDMDKITDQLKRLQSLTEFNFDYIQSFSNVVTTLGQEVVQNIPNSSTLLKTSINQHKEKEQEILGKLFKIMY